MFNQYPYLNINDLNLDFILKAIREMKYEVTNFVSINAIKYADPIQWNITSQYEKNTIVIDPVTGTAYISVAPVPAGVALTRPEYWTVVFDLGSFVTRAAQNFTSHWESDTTTTATFPTTTGGWLVWGDVLYKALTNITAGDTYVEGGNIEHFTIEDLYNAYLNTIANILAIIGDLADLTTSDTSSVVNAINSVLNDLNLKIGDLADLTTSVTSDIVHAINSVLDGLNLTIGDIASLTTSDKTNIVNAINSVLSDMTNAVNALTIKNVTFYVPDDGASAQAIINNHLKGHIIGDGVVIQYRDGDYYENQLSLVNYGDLPITIRGNTTDPTLTKIHLTKDNVRAFWLSGSSVTLIDSFHIVGNKRTYNAGVTSWASTLQWGIYTEYGSSLRVKNIIGEDVFYTIYSATSSSIWVTRGDDTIDWAYAYNETNVITLLKGRCTIALHNGDGGFFAYSNSSIWTEYSVSMGNSITAWGLGFGYISEHSSSVYAHYCLASYNANSGFYANDTSSMNMHYSYSRYNGDVGALARDSSCIEVIATHIDHNKTGVVVQAESVMWLSGTNYINDNSQNGILLMLKSTCMSMGGGSMGEIKNNLCGAWVQKGCQWFGNYPTGANTHGAIHLAEMTGRIENALAANVIYDRGDIIYNNTDNASDTIYAWVCTKSGSPGTWGSIAITP